MRWFWIDRFEEFVAGQYAVSVKNVSLGEEQIDNYSPGMPYHPAALIIEGMAQTGGLLLSQISDFKKRIVLAKVGKAEFKFEAVPGDTIRFRCELTSMSENGAMAHCTAHVGEELLADVDLMFATLEDNKRFDGVTLFEPAGFCRMIRLMKLFDVGVNPDGSPVQIPQHMLDAEKASLQTNTG